MKGSDVMSIDIIAATENVSAIEVATRIEWRGIRRNAKKMKMIETTTTVLRNIGINYE